MGYLEVTLDMDTVLRRINQAGKKAGVSVSALTEQNGLIVPALTRQATQPNAHSI